MTPRQIAKAQGNRLYTGEPCTLGHGNIRRVGNGQCAECRRVDGIARYKADPEKVKSRTLKWQKEQVAKSRAKTRRWAKANPEKNAAKAARQMAAKLKRLPKWANKAAIDSVYALARKLAKETGLRIDVDHFYPLRGKTVSGLHVGSNLRILTRADNLAKGNK